MLIQIQTNCCFFFFFLFAEFVLSRGMLINTGEVNRSKGRFKCQVNGKDLEHQSSWCTFTNAKSSTNDERKITLQLSHVF